MAATLIHETAFETQPEQRTALYRHFGSNGELLYIGISTAPMRRLHQHKDRPWFDQIANVTIEWHPTRQIALDCEMQAIRVENPKFNIVYALPARADFVAPIDGPFADIANPHPVELLMARKSLGLTQAQLAPLLGYCDKTRISELERGTREPGAAVVLLLRAYLAGYRPDDWP